MKTLFAIALLSAVFRIFAATLQESYALEYNGKYNEALAAMEALARDNPKEYFYALRAGYIAYLAGKYTLSLEHYQRALLLQSDALEPRLGRLLPLLALGRYQEAELEAQVVLHGDAKNYTARLKLAYAAYMSGAFARAEKYYASLAIDYPSDATVLLGLGWALLKQGKKDAAHTAFLRVRTIYPDNKYAADGLAWTNR